MVLGLIAGSVAIADAAPRPAADGLTKLIASDGMASDRFGVGVAVSGDTAIVGAPIEDGQQGAAYVYTRIGGTWVEQAKLVASDRLTSHKFGFSVALSGDTAVIGSSTAVVATSPYHSHPFPGSAHVFQRVGEAWIEQAKLTASDGSIGDDFGSSVAVSGDTVVVGAPRIDVGSNADQGAAYVFSLAGGVWSEQTKLTAPDGAADDNFGVHVALSGATAVVGSYFKDVNGTANQGSAYVFTQTDGDWIQEAELSASDGTADDGFGFWVEVSRDTAIVGALWDDVGTNADQGSAYLFARNGGTWTQQEHLVASDGAAGDFFGRSVAISGDTAVVGAQYKEVGAYADQGAAYVFDRAGGTWPERSRFSAPDGGEGNLFGVSVAMSGGTAVIGAGFQDVGINVAQGAAYIWDDTKKSRSRTERTVEGEYGPFPAPVTGCNGVLDPFACLIVQTRSSESYFTAKVTDVHGQPVFVQVKSGGSQTIATFCGETEHPIPFNRGASLEFMLVLPKWPGEMHLDCPASRVKTTGTISVTLTNAP
jgi:hypothetical protein